MHNDRDEQEQTSERQVEALDMREWDCFGGRSGSVSGVVTSGVVSQLPRRVHWSARERDVSVSHVGSTVVSSLDAEV
jgi:hypothetical protein